MRKFHSCGYTACLVWLTFIAVVGWGLQLQRVAVERGAGACRGHGQEPVSVSRLRAPLSSANLPIYFSSGDDRRMQRARATTARYGRDSAAAGQGARARSRQRAEGATVGCTNGEAGIHPGASADQVKWGEERGSSAYNCNLRLPAIRRKLSVPALASCLSCFVYVAVSRVSS